MMVGLCVCGWAADRLTAQPIRRGPPIEFSDPRSDLLRTNANQLSHGDQPQSQLREQLQYRPSPLDLMRDPLRRATVLPPPPGPRVQSARIRELLQRQRDWTQPGSDPLEDIPSLEGERRLRENPLETDQAEPAPPTTDEWELWARYAERLRGEPGAGEEPTPAEDAGDRPDMHTRPEWETPESRAARERLDQLETALKRDGEERSLIRQLPGLTDSVWESPEELAQRAWQERQKDAREQRLQQFRSGLEAVVATPPGGLDAAPRSRAESGTGTSRSTGMAPLWLKPPPDPLGVGGLTGAAQRPAWSGPGVGGEGPARGSSLNSSLSPPSIPGLATAPSSPLRSSLTPTPPPSSPRLRGPNMPSPFTEIPKRPGI